MTDKAWYNFQEEICEYFKSLGFDAETNKTIIGVRTTHDIDVYVQSKFMGHNLIWIIEAKKWKTKINKLQVLALRTILDDIGADRGFIISEHGFQRGTTEASLNTNVTLLTFTELKLLTKAFVEDDILEQFEERIKLIHRRYWTHSSEVRKDYDLRLGLGDNDAHYSVPFVINTAKWAIKLARIKEYPINLNTSLKEQYGDIEVENFQQLTNWLNLNFNIIDKKILDAELRMQKAGEFNPIFGD